MKITIISILAFAIHDFYSSITVFEFNQTSSRFEIIGKYFEDDFIAFVQSKNSSFTIKESPQSELKPILEDHMQLFLNKKKINLNFIGMTRKNDIIILLFESDGIKESGELEIKNTLLLSKFEDQVNIIQLKSGLNRRAAVINRDQTSATFKWLLNKPD